MSESNQVECSLCFENIIDEYNTSHCNVCKKNICFSCTIMFLRSALKPHENHSISFEQPSCPSCRANDQNWIYTQTNKGKEETMDSLFPIMTNEIFTSVQQALALFQKYHKAKKDHVIKQYLQDTFLEHKMFFSKCQVETLFQALKSTDDYEIGHVIVCMCNVPWTPDIMPNENGALCYFGNMAACPGNIFRCIELVLGNSNFIQIADTTKNLFRQKFNH